MGHTDKTCFQPGGKMEGCREEYLANRLMKAQAHLANVEEILEAEITLDTVDELLLKQEFAAMSINFTNDINFASYPMLSPTV